MNKEEFAIHYHRLVFDNACHKKQGNEFQAFFEDIMEKADSSFIRVKPSGRDGDWKCDGFSQESGTVYQCYGPDELTVAKTRTKINEDFCGALEKWGSQMKQWVFVYSDCNKLPARVVSLVQTLKSNYTAIRIDTWNRERLWEVIADLPYLNRAAILGIVPELSEVTEVTAAEVETLLNYVIQQDVSFGPEDFRQTDIVEKIRKNGLSDSVKEIIRCALPIAKVVEDYVRRHPDILYSSKVASVLTKRYKTLVTQFGEDADRIFGELVCYVGHSMTIPKTFWAAAGIVSYYFQLCDVFEP